MLNVYIRGLHSIDSLPPLSFPPPRAPLLHAVPLPPYLKLVPHHGERCPSRGGGFSVCECVCVCVCVFVQLFGPTDTLPPCLPPVCLPACRLHSPPLRVGASAAGLPRPLPPPVHQLLQLSPLLWHSLRQQQHTHTHTQGRVRAGVRGGGRRRCRGRARAGCSFWWRQHELRVEATGPPHVW